MQVNILQCNNLNLYIRKLGLIRRHMKANHKFDLRRNLNVTISQR